MSVLVLGSRGFVGRNVSRALTDDNLDHVEASRRTGVDLRDYGRVVGLIRHMRPKVLINCAAHVGSLNYVSEQAADVMVENTEMVLAIYKAIASESPGTVIINPIANCVYPGNLEIYQEDQVWNGAVHRSVLSYGSSRRFLLALSECFYIQNNIRTISLLVPNMYGPFDSTDPNKAHAMNALVSKFVKAKGEAVKAVSVWGSGIAIREWLFAKDFGRIIAMILKNPDMLGLDEPTNIGQNFGLSVREIVTLIREQVSYGGRIEFDRSKQDGAPKKVMSDQRFRKVFPNFDFTPMQQGIAETVAYYESIYPY